MYIEIDVSGRTLLKDAANFREFKVVADEAWIARPMAFARMGAIAKLDGQYAWVRTDWLREQLATHTSPAAYDGLNGMIEFARRSGWFDEQGNTVRAHIEIH